MDPVTLNGRYINAMEAAKRLGIVRSRMSVLLRDGRVRGATRFGTDWAIPVPLVVYEHMSRPQNQTKIRMRKLDNV